jgi:hypothetical protein
LENAETTTPSGPLGERFAQLLLNLGQVAGALSFAGLRDRLADALREGTLDIGYIRLVSGYLSEAADAAGESLSEPMDFDHLTARGSGRYGLWVEAMHEGAGPNSGIALIVLNGLMGNGMSMKVNTAQLLGMPALLRSLADGIQGDIEKGRP